ncbi:MAG: phage/plasmid primase, P4 family [Lentisphaeraceae bacterium]|nr:phage/plasmid primase, P4 family [Lentisphaeraceae bacterium]
MNYTFNDAVTWLKCNVPVSDVLRTGSVGCKHADSKGGCPKLAFGETNEQGVHTFRCMSENCAISGSCIDMHMHMHKLDFKSAVEDLCAQNSIFIMNEPRYETKVNTAGWQEWPWFSPDKKLLQVKKRNKSQKFAGQSRPATEEEIKLGYALGKPLVYECDEKGDKVPVSEAAREVEEWEERLGFLLEEIPTPKTRTRGKKVGQPYSVYFNKYYKVNMVDCLGKGFSLEWTYLANKWHKKVGEDICLVEGEKDADVLDAIGILATTTGACNVEYTPDLANKLSGRRRFHFRDNDLPGAKSLLNRLKVFSGVDGEDFWVRIPDHKQLLEEKGQDVRDYLNDHSNEEFKQLIKVALPVTDDLIEQLETEHKQACEKFLTLKEANKGALDSPNKKKKLKVEVVVTDPDEEKYDTNKEPFFRPTETGNGLRLKHRYGNKLRSCMKGFESEWLIWNGHKWQVDTKNKETFLLTKEVSEMIRREASTRESLLLEGDKAAEKFIEKLHRWSLTSESVASRKNTLESCAAEPGILTDHVDFDTNHYLINCKNGTVDFNTGMFRSHHKEDLITKSFNVNFDKDADCPKFKRFISAIMLEDQELCRYMQRLIGYSMTGLTREECMHMFIGEGQNGKGVLMELIGWLMGDYSLSAETDMFLMKRSEAAASSDVARLMGARLVLASETNDGATFNEAKLKSLSSRDRLTARYNHSNPFSFYPTHKLILATNKIIRVTGKDRGIWRRIRVIKFLLNVSNEDRDKDLQDDLRAEAAGILNWALDGFQEYKRLDGLRPPKKVTNWVEDYKESMDYLAEFFEKYCVIDEVACYGRGELFEKFHDWQKNELKESKPYNQVTFNRIMEQHNFKIKRERNKETGKAGPRMWSGIRLKTLEETRAEEHQQVRISDQDVPEFEEF